MKNYFFLVLLISAAAFAQKNKKNKTPQVKVEQGILEGIALESGVNSFRGIPYAQPPVGELRWREPQPPTSWKGVRKADTFSNRAMQKPIYSDMNFRSPGISEDCLYLNVWTPSKKGDEKLPVMVYFHGGGFIAGDGSEYRYDGESISEKGVVVVTLNYRLGIFGFFAHPDLTRESPNRASGNYGLLDQHAALLWVKANIDAFGGDPNKITIAGESAGSIAVSAHMASPLSKGLIAGAIGQSGAMINPTQNPVPFNEANLKGRAFGEKVRAPYLADLRSMPAEQLLEEASKPGAYITRATIDGYFLQETPLEVFTQGTQSAVPLLAGWTSAEGSYAGFMNGEEPTPANYEKKMKEYFGDKANEALKLYPGTTKDDVMTSAAALTGDRFIVYSTWKWAEQQRQVARQPVYVYTFSKERPGTTSATHASDIEYLLGNLASNKVYRWTSDDYKVSQQAMEYLVNFIKFGSPDGPSVQKWPVSRAGEDMMIMDINVQARAVREQHRERYLFLDKFYNQPE
jgi:para-nitrobenzyl esterase